MNTKTSNKRLRSGVFFVLSLVIACSTFLSAEAAGPVIRSGETVGVEASQVLEGDFYGFGQTVTISGAAEQDVYVLGGAVTTNAPVSGDLVVLGGVVQIHGEVKDDLRVIGGEVVIADAVAGDVVAVGGTVHILSTATIGGDLIFFGAEIRIDGPIQGAVYGTGETVRIDAHVGGNVSVRGTQSFTLGDTAEVVGNINYKSTTELVRAQGAVVNGTITRDTLFPTEEKFDAEPLVINILILIFSSLTIFFLAKARTSALIHKVFEGYGRSGLIGLGMCIALPIVAVILMASIIGFLAGVALLFAYVVLLALAFMCLPILLGAIAQRLARQGSTITIFTVLLGVALAMLLSLTPVIGGFVLFLGFLVLVGALCNEVYLAFKRG